MQRKVSESSANDISDFLREFIKEQLINSRYYEMMASKVQDTKIAKHLKNLSIEELLNAEKLAQVYTETTKKRYIPNYRELPKIAMLPLMQALSGRFTLEDKAANKYLRIARKTNNKDLRDLFFTLSEAERRHAGIVYSIMETLKYNK